MGEIARTLEAAGFLAFLPQRDVFIFSDVHREFLRGGYESAEATALIQQAIFWLDVTEVVSHCQALVLNMNGRVPDEGAVAEGAMAWMAGKPIVLYKSDARSKIQGSDNPLLLGLGNFVKVSTIPEIAFAFTQLFRARREMPELPLPREVRFAVESGRRLAKLLDACESPADMVPVIVSFLRKARNPRSR